MEGKARLPKFHSKGHQGGDFYVMAYYPGRYVAPSRTQIENAFLVLNFSPSNGFTQFSFAIDAVDGRALAYHRGINENDNIETALLTACYEYEMPVHLWTIFPGNKIGPSSFANKRKHRTDYFSNRNQLCFLLKQYRLAAWFKTNECAKHFKFKRPVESLFKFKAAPQIRNPYEPNDENREIYQGAFDFFKERQTPKRSTR